MLYDEVAGHLGIINVLAPCSMPFLFPSLEPGFHLFGHELPDSPQLDSFIRCEYPGDLALLRDNGGVQVVMGSKAALLFDV